MSIVRYGFGLRAWSDAVRYRNHVLRCFERAMLEPDAERRRALLTFVWWRRARRRGDGGGAVRAHPAVLVKDYPRLNIKDVRVLLLEQPTGCSRDAERLREARAETLWRKKHVEVDSARRSGLDGERITLRAGSDSRRTLIWAAGAKAGCATATLG